MADRSCPVTPAAHATLVNHSTRLVTRYLSREVVVLVASKTRPPSPFSTTRGDVRGSVANRAWRTGGCVR
jgi:hypothetical protein